MYKRACTRRVCVVCKYTYTPSLKMSVCIISKADILNVLPKKQF